MINEPSAIRRALCRGAFLACWLLSQHLHAAQPLPQHVDFNFHIRPLLSDRCFKCHGPDEKSRKADLRLDNADGAFAVLDKADGRRAIVPHKSQASEVMKRITSTAPEEMMPPPDSKLQLSKEEIALIKKWIDQGAEYKSHWAFIAPKKATPPKTANRSWIRNPIDQFVLARLQEQKLKPAGEASKEILIRRLSLDLTGLPPSVAEVERFSNDTSPQAYDKVVDWLLASPAYGERMANDWLDLARYADTYGYQSDVERDMYPWRDWVIRAFNQNLSYDQFITWQIAGDLLPDATDEQVLATAFNRLHRQTNEGGSIEEEFRNEYVSDRVHTFGTAFLGLTLECSRCHDHKYDPIKQRDYYSLSAFFNNIDESGLYSHFTQATPTPTLLLYKEGEKAKHLALIEKIAVQESKLTAIEQAAKQRFEQWLTQHPNYDWSVVTSNATKFSFDQIAGNKCYDTAGKTEAVLGDGPKQVEGAVGKALQFDGESSVSVRAADFKRTDSFSFALWLKPTEKQDRAVVFHHSRSWTDSGSRGYELILEKGKVNFALIHFWPGNAISVRTREPLPLNEWTHLAITYDGSSHASGIQVYRNGKLEMVDVIRDHLYKDILHRAEWGDSDVGGIQLTLAARFRDSGFKNGLIDEFTVFDKCLQPIEVRANYVSQTNKTGVAANINTLSEGSFEFFLHRIDPAYQAAVAELKLSRENENKFVNDIREIMVMRELSWRRPTFVLKRGAYDAPTDAVEPGTPERIFPFSPEYPKNRLGLAKWLTDPGNPLTARIVVNRIWKMHFGRGLVATAEDFGSQGQLPTHPELLDWLARNFIESGWDVKALHKLIVTSATYRQTSIASPDLQSVDPDNRLLARGPKHRLQAEQIRDAALAVTGLLSPRVGGPSVKPYQPAGLWENSGLSKSYVQDQGDNLYRRSLYTFWRRTSPPPSMLTFDATSREVCTAKRETTATPLQALVLLNDPQFLEASRVLAEKVIREDGAQIEMAIDMAFQTVLGHLPKERERTILKQLYSEQLELFKNNAGTADKVLAIGEHPRDPKQSNNEVAAMTIVINTLMNHDEFVMKR